MVAIGQFNGVRMVGSRAALPQFMGKPKLKDLKKAKDLASDVGQVRKLSWPYMLATVSKFPGAKSFAGGGIMAGLGVLIASLSAVFGSFTTAGVLTHQVASSHIGGAQRDAVAEFQDASEELTPLNANLLKPNAAVPYFHSVNEALEAYNGLSIENIPTYQALSESGQQKTQQLLIELQEAPNWQDNWKFHSQQFGQWIDEVLVQENIITKNEAKAMKAEAKEVFEKASDYESLHRFGVHVIYLTLMTTAGGIGMAFLGKALAKRGFKKGSAVVEDKFKQIKTMQETGDLQGLKAEADKLRGVLEPPGTPEKQ